MATRWLGYRRKLDCFFSIQPSRSTRYCGRHVVPVGLQSEKHFRTINVLWIGQWSLFNRCPVRSVLVPTFHDMLYLYSEVVMLAIRLPQSIEKRLEKLARRTGRTKTYYVREAILEHLEGLEDMYLAEGALKRIRSGEEETIPLKDVMKRHGLQR